jgi:hypothetical protein
MTTYRHWEIINVFWGWRRCQQNNGEFQHYEHYSNIAPYNQLKQRKSPLVGVINIVGAGSAGGAEYLPGMVADGRDTSTRHWCNLTCQDVDIVRDRFVV